MTCVTARKTAVSASQKAQVDFDFLQVAGFNLLHWKASFPFQHLRAWISQGSQQQLHTRFTKSTQPGSDQPSCPIADLLLTAPLSHLHSGDANPFINK